MVMISSSLIDKINSFGIILIFGDIEGSGFFYPSENAIIINEKLLESPDVNFAIAHELSHFLKNHLNEKALYDSSFSNKSKIEKQADISGIDILIEIYIQEYEIESDQINSLHFMEAYGIKSSLYDYIDKRFRIYLLNEYQKSLAITNYF